MRYPGTQFVLRDHSNVSAAVPIQQVSNSAPVFMSSFRAPKGPEDMLLVEGQRFYNLYGSQDKIKFNTYKQPLLQASMDINEGARLIAKRAVLDSAKLANATFGVILTKQVDVKIIKENDAITGAEYGTTTKYVLRPAFVSIKDNEISDHTSIIETKYQYKDHKKRIIDDIESSESFQIETGIAGYVEGDTAPIMLLDGSFEDTTYTVGNIKNGNCAQVVFGNIGTTVPTRGETSDAVYLNKLYTDDTGKAAHGGEYFFPLFTIFDNGRGTSLKNYSVVFDVNTSKSINTAVYTLKISDTVTARTLESFAFTINPYARNSNTGYTFDIESAVNLKSDQISVKYYYDSYDKLVQTINDQLGIVDENIFINNDCLFNHKLSGMSYGNNAIVNGDSNGSLYCVADMDVNNIDDGNENITYYYYNYAKRVKNNITERLAYGYDGDIDTTVFTQTSTDCVVDNQPTPVLDSDAHEIDDETSLTTPKNLGFKVGTGAAIEQNFANAVNFLKKATNLDINFGGVDYTNSESSVLRVNTPGGYLGITVLITKCEAGTQNDTLKYTFTVNVKEYSWEASYQNQYRKFFNGQFDKDIFNLDVWFPNCVFDCNYDKKVKLAIQRLAAYRGDFLVYLDLNTDIKTLEDVEDAIPANDPDIEFPVDEENATQYYIHDRNCAVTSIYGDIRDPYSNKQITVTGTYPLSRIMVKHFINGVGRPFAGQGYGIVFSEFIEGTVNYIPKIYPSDAMTSRSFIGDTYPSDDSVIINEKQIMTDLKVNYGSYYNGTFTMDTEFTLNPADSDFSFINNIMLVHQVMQAVRRSCPASRYRFIDNNDLSTYQKDVEEVLKVYRSKFASLKFKYVQDENSVANKIYYAAIEVVFRPFAQAEIFTITALNYSTLSSNVTTV